MRIAGGKISSPDGAARSVLFQNVVKTPRAGWPSPAHPTTAPASRNSFGRKGAPHSPSGEGGAALLGVLASGSRRMLRNYCRWAPFRAGPLGSIAMDFRANLFDSRSFVPAAGPLPGGKLSDSAFVSALSQVHGACQTRLSEALYFLCLRNAREEYGCTNAGHCALEEQHGKSQGGWTEPLSSQES